MANTVCDTTQPLLPLELEQTIVEIAAFMIISFPLSSTSCALELQLTTKRFREWTVPFLYRVLHIDRFFAGRTQSKAIEILNRYGKHTRQFFGRWDKENTIEGLKRCPMLQGIVNLHILLKFEEMHAAIQHHDTSSLQRLSAIFSTLKPELLLSPVYCNITHLEIVGFISDPKVLVSLPNLTHLCFASPTRIADPNVLLDPVTEKAVGRKSLEVVVYSSEDTRVPPADVRVIKLKRPLRYLIHLAQWMRHVNGEMDFWELAERMIFARRDTFFSIYSYCCWINV
ncbi:hypothetical protein CVT24_005451 [Panaeolus cyanescens]|uniref:F-box domain-containing protein n=1 Tax=Panaeolus cyanescens TaxID=181874 RepID=A0A409WTF1_9AGAR|nr:hypothetical protein CVT24_005451 [Panaeolus cyanescens]